MSQIIEIENFGPVRFSILSENKIQLEYKIFIIINSLFSQFNFDDISWHRNMLLKNLLTE